MAIDLVKFAARIENVDGCWTWTGALGGGGYAQWKRPVQIRVHRWSYEFFVGPIPDGLVIDHLCRNRACVNPDHLEPVTRHQNVLRGLSPIPPNRHASKETCPQGHPYNAFSREGWRKCNTCHSERERARRLAAKRAAE